MKNNPTPVIITGALGRMGRELLNQAYTLPEYGIVGATEHPKSHGLGQDMGTLIGVGGLTIPLSASLEEVFSSKDNLKRRTKPVIIDFTSPPATLNHLSLAVEYQVPMVIGTTGFEESQKAAITKAAKKIPIVMAPNMSVGVNALFQLVGEAARILGKGYDIEILEAHHRLKKDAPSGTAVKLAEILAASTGRTYPTDFNFHRQGQTGERPSNEIGMQVIRGGDIVGEHTVYFIANGERVELTHVATSRSTFAQGALRAAAWLQKQKPGLYDMKGVLGIKE